MCAPHTPSQVPEPPHPPHSDPAPPSTRHPQACVVSHGDAQGAVVNVMAIDRKVEAAVLSKAAELADVSQVHCLHIG